MLKNNLNCAVHGVVCSNSDIYRICVILMIKILNLDQLDLIGVKSTQKKEPKTTKDGSMDHGEKWVKICNFLENQIWWFPQMW